MSAKTLIEKLADIAKRYNAAQAGVLAKARKDYAGLDSYTPEARASALKQERGFVVQDFTDEVARLAKTIASEKAELPLEIGKLKYPLLMSGDSAKQLLGEVQVNSAQVFLSMKPMSAVLLNAIRSALTLGRLDFANTVADAARLSIPVDSAPTQEQYALKTGLDDIAASLSTPKLDEQLADLASFGDVERIAGEMSRQVDAGAEILYLPDLFPLMSEAEQNAAKASSQFNLTEQVLADGRRKKAAEKR